MSYFSSHTFHLAVLLIVFSLSNMLLFLQGAFRQGLWGCVVHSLAADRAHPVQLPEHLSLLSAGVLSQRAPE